MSQSGFGLGPRQCRHGFATCGHVNGQLHGRAGGRHPVGGLSVATTLLLGVDFTSRPTPRKPIVLACGQSRGAVLRLGAIHRFASNADFSAWLDAHPAWIGGFDLPFGLPRELVQHLDWPTDWAACIARYGRLDRAAIRATFAAFCDARPAGGKFAHRACDRPAGSSPSMKWVNPPVAYMLHAGVPLLQAVGASFAAHAQVGTRPERIALEAYPGLLARQIIGRRSYKADDRAKQTPDRLIARLDLIDALARGQPLPNSTLAHRLVLSDAQRDAMSMDASGDTLDAVLCLAQAAWAAGQTNWGLPADVDPLEGWIISA